MSKSNPIFSSTVGKKLVMSLTGLFLCLFLIVHLIGNLQLFYNDAGYAFNKYAVFMTTFPPIKIVSYLLYASVIIHALYALILTRKNKAARPIGYKVYDGNAGSKWNSRNMGILGTIVLVFLVTHMQNFWYQYHWGEVPYIEYTKDLATGEISHQEISASDFHEFTSYVENGKEITKAKDLYRQVEFAFENIGLVVLYIIAMGALAFHLIHGFKSAFQTLGFNHRRYIGLIRFLGIWVFGLLIPLAFAAIPFYYYFIR